ncbi:MAG TPA: hypothetical protein VK828_17455 [Terriglobales bacterium]|jgi:hypothetical protein|nr:hypothetical protein [Terriglobales bacterium]
MTLNRRQFVTALIASGAAAAPTRSIDQKLSYFGPSTSNANPPSTDVDFRYAPRIQQSTICYPDDSKKTIVGQAGDLRYGYVKSLAAGMENFGTVVEFSLAGFQDDKTLRQWIESPGVPIVHTLIDRLAATFELIAFASRHADEGRVDNVLLSIRSKTGRVASLPKIHIRTCERLELESYTVPTATVRVQGNKSPLLVAAQLDSNLGSCMLWEEEGFTLYLPHGEAFEEMSARYFVRLPQDNQSAETVGEHLHDAEMLLAEARELWRNWKPFGTTNWSFPGRQGEFLTACARNIQQAREIKNNRLVFQVGPTQYRGLWIVDGNFLLEAARYLGYDQAADEGLRSEWTKQAESGQVIAEGGGEHWKDTAIAVFTLVRQCELKQDWTFFCELEPNVVRALDFLIGLRDRARSGPSTNGRYGLLAPGFADGGIGGVRSEFTNTAWTLAALRAVADAGDQLKLPSLARARTFFHELLEAFQQMARQEMVRHPAGFEYLPMIAHDDSSVADPDPWNRPRPQTAQWALSHAIFPGEVFEKNDPIVRGHIALLQSCTQEDVPTETGWLWHDSLWTYNASFAAHVYLWAGLNDWAHRTFTGFLNHASPLYCWREEQPLQHALAGQDWGDMPHNWASAECIRYLRHMLALEDRKSLRLLNGITAAELVPTAHYSLQDSPTRFGRINLELEPAGAQEWRLRFDRSSGLSPSSVSLPASIGPLQVRKVIGASSKINGQVVEVDPIANKWDALLK